MGTRPLLDAKRFMLMGAGILMRPFAARVSRCRSFDTGSDETDMSAESGKSPRDLEAFSSH